MNSAKYDSELDFWNKEFRRYQQWYNGEMPLNGEAPLCESCRRLYPTPQTAWVERFQKPLYLTRLGCSQNIFYGKKVLEIGCGPVSGRDVFAGAEHVGVDPLLGHYRGLGYDIKPQDITAFAEFLPFLDSYFDAVISINALDHVDFPEKVAEELQRVCKPDVLIALNVEYHSPRICEPVSLDETKLESLFYWVPSFQKKDSFDGTHTWRNF